MKTKNSKEYEIKLLLGYTAWKDKLTRDIPDYEVAKDIILDQARQFEDFYVQNHGNKPVELAYSNGKTDLLSDLTNKSYVDRESIPPLMFALQKLTYNEFQKTKDVFQDR